jgi:alkanesulfonate monooxygenase SsuD/methylene tetrahydromethanopterin reductase-like flavin-dependent oxidoreductase (luciferase family)
MTAAGMDYVSDGRFSLGIGASGPQVIEGFHGVRYDAPLGRTRELVEICRKVWRREKLVHDGRHYRIPLPADEGTGLGKPLKLINHPVRERIPIFIAAIGPRNVAMTAEIAEGWEPIFFHPEKAAQVWGPSLAEGRTRRDPALALYIGGMGARGRNFYYDLACRYGHQSEATTIQDLYLAGRKDAAAAAVPASLLRDISLIGPTGYIKERLAAYAEAGVTTLNVTPMARTHPERVALVEQLRDLLA